MPSQFLMIQLAFLLSHRATKLMEEVIAKHYSKTLKRYEVIVGLANTRSEVYSIAREYVALTSIQKTMLDYLVMKWADKKCLNAFPFF